MADAVQSTDQTIDSPKKYSFWAGLLAAFIGPQSKFSGVRRGFSSKGIATKLSFVLIIAAIVSGFATYAALTETPPFGDNPDVVIWLLNIDLVILLMLVTLIARRVLKIWIGRRRGIAGSRLHIRLVLILMVMAALPAIIMAVFSAFFFHFGVQTWFSDNVRTAVVESQAVATAYLEEHKQVIKADTLAMANDIDRNAPFMGDLRADELERLMDTQSIVRNLSEAIIFNESGKILTRSSLTFTLTFENLPNYLLDQAGDGDVVVMTSENEDRVRALVKLNNWNDSYLYVGRRIDPTVLGHIEATQEAVNKYSELEGSYSGLQITVTMIFIVVALLLLLAAIWVGIVLARQLVLPITTLISVSDRVRGGDLTARVPEQKQIEEFDYLASSFNRMTSQIEEQRNELIMANRMLDQRRRLTETVLAGVSAGIVGVDSRGLVTFVNAAAAEIFEQESKELVGRKITSVIPNIAEHLDKAHSNTNKVTQFENPYISHTGKKSELLVRIAIELISEEEQGAVITFDDITELQSAQLKAAWADVARRIAHEIKNPLTPIQLSAERLKRKYLSEIKSDPETFEVCTETIIRHVEDIGRMVNEFSDFARMPVANLKAQKLQQNVSDVMMLHKQAHPKIKISFHDNTQGHEIVLCDEQQIRQALVNLIQNSIDAISQDKQSVAGEIDIILKPIEHKSVGHGLMLLVTDSGIGLPENEEAANLTEPYVTHRPKGTGLGLAIVKKIMEDHNGKIIVGADKYTDNKKLSGASIALLFPIAVPEKQDDKKTA